MNAWSVADLLAIVQSAFATVSGGATQVTYTQGTTSLVATGTFSNFDANGDPQSGTVQGIQYTTQQFLPGVASTITMSGFSLSVATLTS